MEKGKTGEEEEEEGGGTESSMFVSWLGASASVRGSEGLCHSRVSQEGLCVRTNIHWQTHDELQR